MLLLRKKVCFTPIPRAALQNIAKSSILVSVTPGTSKQDVSR